MFRTVLSIGDIFQFKQAGAALTLFRRIEPVDGTAHHHGNELRFVNLADVLRADMSAVAQHRDAVGQGKDFRHAVADIDDGDAARFEVAHDIHEALHIGFGQCGGRLIHDQHAGILGQRPGDFDALAICHRE